MSDASQSSWRPRYPSCYASSVASLSIASAASARFAELALDCATLVVGSCSSAWIASFEDLATQTSSSWGEAHGSAVKSAAPDIIRDRTAEECSPTSAQAAACMAR